MIVYWSVPKNCVTLTAALRLGRRHVHLGKCLRLSSSQAGAKSKNVGTATVLAKPAVRLILYLCAYVIFISLVVCSDYNILLYSIWTIASTAKFVLTFYH